MVDSKCLGLINENIKTEIEKFEYFFYQKDKYTQILTFLK